MLPKEETLKRKLCFLKKMARAIIIYILIQLTKIYKGKWKFKKIIFLLQKCVIKAKQVLLMKRKLKENESLFSMLSST
jgi:hypothetical protein